MITKLTRPLLSRRIVLRGFGSAIAVAPFAALAGCSNDNALTAADAGSDISTTVGGADAGVDSGAEAAVATDGASVPWATGGTASMTAKATYPNPFAGGVTQTSCALTCSATQGPCYSSQSETIQDISYGYAGLPTRVYLQVLDDACRPLAGAVVDVWHVSAVGKYSGDDATNEDIAFCTGNDAEFTSKLYFRGKQTTDANGVVYFDTCYPGWYSGRTVHVHFTIRVGTDASLTSQLFFDDTLNDDILESQALYDSRGNRDTTNQNDSVVAASAVADYTFSTRKMSDGALLAWKTVIVRAAASESLCTIPGGSGGGMGGPSDGGMGNPPEGGMGVPGAP
ncbi:MAG TPA: protocatechuate 3,4-dioxygenase [Polyangia bacterium]|nr:protocatechuate 3,4-dioxygenase [Polyangia bacterium]